MGIFVADVTFRTPALPVWGQTILGAGFKLGPATAIAPRSMFIASLNHSKDRSAAVRFRNCSDASRKRRLAASGLARVAARHTVDILRMPTRNAQQANPVTRFVIARCSIASGCRLGPPNPPSGQYQMALRADTPLLLSFAVAKFLSGGVFPRASSAASL